MTEENQTPQDRPLVTFALFAYNQEKYIREAVEGAFSQTYEPLEIILSDDCSSDRTFEIMQEMAAAYQGPHEVRVRQSETNVGIIDHVLSAVKRAKGNLIIVAAGDDISLPQRTASITTMWKKSGAAAIYSGCQEIDDDGNVVNSEVFPEPLARIQSLFSGCKSPKRYDGLVRNIPGYSAAYSKDFLTDLPYTNRKIHNEDALSTYLLNLLGKEIGYVKEVLVRRRLAKSSISAASRMRSVEEVMRNEFVIQRFSKSSLLFIDYFSELEIARASPDFKCIYARLSMRREYLEVVSRFWDASLRDRWQIFAWSRGKSTRKFILPRLLGIRFFCVFRLSSNLFRRTS